MSARADSLARVELVALAFGDLVDDVAFVGGASLPFYLPVSAGETRPTLDVDCVVEAATRGHLGDIEAKLRKRGFREDQASGVICRWYLGSTVVDVMPTEGRVLGLSNAWYPVGWAERERRALPSGREVWVFPFVYFFVSKVEAFLERGRRDWYASKDLEDIVSLLDGRPRALSELLAASMAVRVALTKLAMVLLDDAEVLSEAVAGHLPPVGSSPERVVRVVAMLDELRGASLPDAVVGEDASPRQGKV